MLSGFKMVIRLFYTLLLLSVAPFFLYGLYKSKANKPKFGKRWIEHFGFTKKLEADHQPLWIHTVSVGEVIAAIPLIKTLKQQNPDQTIIMTTTTSTGAAEVKKLGDLIEHRYMPLDFSFTVKGFIKAVNPSALLIMETELWPNTLHVCQQNNIPVTVINARLSERSFLRYQKFQFVFDLLAKNIDKILCQTDDDAKRFECLGIHKEKLSVTGSIKFDITISQEIKSAGQALRKELGLERPIWIAASTHQGEDEQVLQAHQHLLKTLPEALLIIVPRHPERFLAVSELLKENGFNTVTRNSKQTVSSTTSVYIADTMGEMLLLIGASDICFMGGSLLGEKVGGHNLLEPAALAKPSLTGPSFYNFKLITEQLVKAQACIVCETEQEISSNLIMLFADKKEQQKMGDNALNVVNRNKGALAKTLSAITLH